MDTLEISATEFSPEITFNNDTREFDVKGESRPEILRCSSSQY
jgi:hypothetical protein